MNFQEFRKNLSEAKNEEGKPQTTKAFASATPGQPPVVFEVDPRYDGQKIAKELDPAGGIKHQMGHALSRQDNDVDGDVDSQDKHTPDEVVGTPDETQHMLKKNADERKHTKKGVAYESTQKEGVVDTADVKVTASGRKVRAHRIEVDKDEDDSMKEASMSDDQMKKREDIVKGMKKNFSDFVSRYGKDAKSVMYATATKNAMKEEIDLEEAAKTGNEGRGYHGQHESDVADKKYSAMHTKVKSVAGEAGHLRDAKKPNVMVKHYLDSQHGRHLTGHEDDHEYIKKDFGKFKKTYKAEMHEEVEQIDELSKKTLGDYVKKASHDVAHKGAMTRQHSIDSRAAKDDQRYTDARKSDDKANKTFAKSWKRREGMAKAVDRLTKEETSVDEAAIKVGDTIVWNKGKTAQTTGKVHKIETDHYIVHHTRTNTYHKLPKQGSELVESVDLSEATDKTSQRLVQLVRFGLMDKSKLPLLTRAMASLDKGSVSNPSERQVLFELLDDLIGIVTGDDSTFSKIKMQVQK